MSRDALDGDTADLCEDETLFNEELFVNEISDLSLESGLRLLSFNFCAFFETSFESLGESFLSVDCDNGGDGLEETSFPMLLHVRANKARGLCFASIYTYTNRVHIYISIKQIFIYFIHSVQLLNLQ